METPTVSIIVPVHNPERLAETINSLQAQSFQDFEVICVGDSDRLALLPEAAQKDSRFRLLHRNESGVGAAWNAGFGEARGSYVLFPSCGSIFSPEMLEKLYAAAENGEADLAVCDYGKIFPSGRTTRHDGVRKQWLSAGQTVFSYSDCQEYIMRILDPVSGNKLYRSGFLRSYGLKFDDSALPEDFALCAVASAAAQRITWVQEPLVQHRVSGAAAAGTEQELENDVRAILCAARQAEKLPHSEELGSAMRSFVVDNFIYGLTNRVKDFSLPEVERFYRQAHELFNRPEFADVDARTLRNPKRYREFCTVRKHSYETMKLLVSRRIVVSLTTYPRRIGLLGPVLESIYDQTMKADEVVLWLAREQFPGLEADLPENLLKLMDENRLTVRWCDDLKPHKKYFYALQEFTDALVVTVDDDLLYPKDMLDALYRSYLQYPDAVSTVRAHLIMVSEDQKIMPYSTWIQETDQCIYEPSMQLLATGGAGVLYPPNLLRKELFDKEAIREHCLLADDLWLKCMQLMSDVPVVVARPFEQLHYLPDSQEEALHQVNVRRNQNDVQLEAVRLWLDEKYGKDILIRKLTAPDTGVRILGMEAVCAHINAERKAIRNNWLRADKQIRQCNEKIRQAETNLQRAEKERHLTEKRLKQTEEKLRRAEADKKELREKSPIGVQYHDLGARLRQQPKGASWYVKYGIYLLAGIPEKLLVFMMFYLENGGAQTMKRFLNKLRRK